MTNQQPLSTVQHMWKNAWTYHSLGFYFTQCVGTESIEGLILSLSEYILCCLVFSNGVFLFSNGVFVGVYVKFDGLMYPQLSHSKLRELESRQSIWKSLFSKLKSLLVSSNDSDSKHVHLPTLALRVYLSKHHRILTGKASISESPVELITNIIYIFNSLHKACLHIDNCCRFLPNSDDIQKVCIHLYLTKCTMKASMHLFSFVWEIIDYVTLCVWVRTCVCHPWGY